jgi:hypothetical protein
MLSTTDHYLYFNQKFDSRIQLEEKKNQNHNLVNNSHAYQYKRYSHYILPVKKTLNMFSNKIGKNVIHLEFPSK